MFKPVVPKQCGWIKKMITVTAQEVTNEIQMYYIS